MIKIFGLAVILVLQKYDIEEENFTNYTSNDGLLSNDFNFGAVLKDEKGTLYFGNYKGLDYFNPKEIRHKF